MVLLGVNDEQDLAKWENHLKEKEINFKTFIEPDRNNEHTALAVHPKADSKIFRSLKLL
jgi:hypothetical protein